MCFSLFNLHKRSNFVIKRLLNKCDKFDRNNFKAQSFVFGRLLFEYFLLWLLERKKTYLNNLCTYLRSFKLGYVRYSRLNKVEVKTNKYFSKKYIQKKSEIILRK